MAVWEEHLPAIRTRLLLMLTKHYSSRKMLQRLDKAIPLPLRYPTSCPSLPAGLYLYKMPFGIMAPFDSLSTRRPGPLPRPSFTWRIRGAFPSLCEYQVTSILG